jgi:hypothetical protein
MWKRIAGLLVIVLAVILVPAALPQMEPTPTVYTFVSQFNIPRANWAAYSEDSEKTFVPIMEKMTASGTIIGWSTFEQIVHTPDGYTHGAAWESTSIAGLMKVLDEIRKAGLGRADCATKHEDLLTQTSWYHMGTGTPTYLRVVCQMAKADKPDDYAAGIKKYLAPTFDGLVKQGAATYYGLDTQYVVTGPASLRCLVITYPNADGMDKWATAVGGVLGKLSGADREAVFGSVVPDSRRDIMARITHSGHK